MAAQFAAFSKLIKDKFLNNKASVADWNEACDVHVWQISLSLSLSHNYNQLLFLLSAAKKTAADVRKR